MRRVLPVFASIFLLIFTACGQADTPPVEATAVPPPQHTPAAAAETVAAPTVSVPSPTAVLPTDTPVKPSPTATPRPVTPSPTATPTPHVYIVQEGDTLLGLAFEFDTTVAALAAANGISDEDFLYVGQELIIPAPGEVSPQAPDTAPDTPTPAPTAAANPATGTPTAAATAPAPAAELPPTATPVPASNLPAFDLPDNINPLTGLPVDDPAVLRRRPLMVRIGNDVGARVSQVGLNSADMVYEEITEWWVTRFTAIFLANTPPVVGPVRSARLINVQLVPQYQGALAHSGGSDPVRWEISQAPIANLDEFYNPAPYFYRPNEGWQTRLALNAQAARDYMAANGLEAPVSLPGFFFSDTLDRGQPAENIFIPYPRATSFTQWRYDPSSGKYLRWINGAPLVDAASGQVAASNVIVYFAEHQETDIVEDANGATSIRIIVNGRGPAWFFRDGKLNKGYWETDGTRPPYFAFEDGQPYPLKPGNTWVEVVPPSFVIGLNSPDEARVGE